ncbi:hypothetical protein LCGC14_0208220 [marine sediment metagenome]|uniref:Uncharacterized protein n=1 Tax=marine sediment metagenome TaxID=412755 RepID=A0A0F9X0P8_9ZZZZ
MSYKFNILVDKGDFRLVRVTRPGGYGQWLIVQHRCDSSVYEEKLFSDNGWSLCYHSNRRCSCCKMLEPKEMIGFHNLMMWDNKEDTV